MKLCKFTTSASILWEGYDFYVVGRAFPATPNCHYDMRDIGGHIVDVVNLDDGTCHILTASDAVFEVKSDPEQIFVMHCVRK
jgi:hypothetical protein